MSRGKMQYKIKIQQMFKELKDATQTEDRPMNSQT
jgi:hypothetical protein